MGRDRINPPNGAAATIKELASKGYEELSLAEYFNVHVDVFKEWMENNPKLEYAYRMGRELERVALHGVVVECAKNGVTAANRNAMFILQSKYGYNPNDSDNQANPLNVAVNVSPVMIVTDHGTDEEWAEKVAAQQRKLVENAGDEPVLPAPSMVQEDRTQEPAHAVPSLAPSQGYALQSYVQQPQEAPQQPAAVPAWEPAAAPATPAQTAPLGAPAWSPNPGAAPAWKPSN